MARECMTADGRPKRRYDTRAAANQTARRYRLLELIDALATAQRAGIAAKAYRCDRCGWFHIGHYPHNPTARQRLRERHREAS